MSSRTSLLALIFGLVVCLTQTSAQAADPTNCPSGMTAWWKFDANANDSQGASTFTLLNGPIFSTGYIGQGLLLDGVNDYASTPATPSLNLGNSSGMTIEMWIRPTNAARLANLVEWNSGSG